MNTILINPTFSSESLMISISIALLGILYGMFGFLLLLPIRMKLEAMSCIEADYSTQRKEDNL